MNLKSTRYRRASRGGPAGGTVRRRPRLRDVFRDEFPAETARDRNVLYAMGSDLDFSTQHS